MAARPQITLYVDIVSPFAYEAYHILRNDRTFTECEIRYIPILLGGLMKACGNTAPIYIKNKDTWVGTERLRWAHMFGIPMKDEAFPNFPPRTITAMRAVSVVSAMDGDSDQGRLTRVLDALFHGLWAEHRPVHESEVLEEVLCSVLGDEEAKQVFAKLSTDGKALLAKNTDQAFADGAFGLPWMVCTNSSGLRESYWGVDHLGQVVQFLGLQRSSGGGWKALL